MISVFKTRLLTGLFIMSTTALIGCASSTTSESTGQYLDDSVITTRVKSSLVGAKDVKSGHISVKTFKGVVQLSGFVDTPAQVLRAGQVSSKVHGVVRVEND